MKIVITGIAIATISISFVMGMMTNQKLNEETYKEIHESSIKLQNENKSMKYELMTYRQECFTEAKAKEYKERVSAEVERNLAECMGAYKANKQEIADLKEICKQK